MSPEKAVVILVETVETAVTNRSLIGLHGIETGSEVLKALRVALLELRTLEKIVDFDRGGRADGGAQFDIIDRLEEL